MTTHAQLKAFHALAIEKSFHRAAERLRLTQPAVSAQIKLLERESRRPLFRRRGHMAELTGEGQALFGLTTRMFGAEAEVKRLLSATSGEVERVVHLGADGPHVALDLITRSMAAHPSLRFRVTLANAETTWENLLALRVDVAVMANARADKRVHSRVISQQSLLALVPFAHPLGGRDSAGLNEIAAHPLIFREQGSNTQRIVDAALAGRGLHPQVALVMGSREGVREAVSRGLGIGFGFDRELGHAPGFATVAIAGYEHSNTDMLVCLKAQRDLPQVRALLDLLPLED